MSSSSYCEVILSFIKSSEAKYVYIRFSVCHICFLILFSSFNQYFSASLSAPTISPSLPLSLSLMMGVFLFCGGCELSEFVSVSIIPSLWAPAYKSGQGPSAPSHRPPVSAPCLLLYAHTATGKTVDKHLRQGEKKRKKGGIESKNKQKLCHSLSWRCDCQTWLVNFHCGLLKLTFRINIGVYLKYHLC